jgi:hypothetical protein
MGRSSRSSGSSRTSTLRKPAPKARPAAQPTSKAPAPVQPASNNLAAQQQPQQSQSFLGAMASTVASGFAFGTGSAVAHRAVDSVLGPRHGPQGNETELDSNDHVQQSVPTSVRSGELCAADLKAFNDCLVRSNNNIGECQFYFDILQQCKNNA